jgi:energy-coupling factor transporter ATP-binding protein EcfA2
MVDITIQAGSRGYITGQSGSGKTTLALALCEAMPSPLVVLDTKYDPGIGKWAKLNGLPIVSKDMPDWRKIKSDMVVRPPADWLANPQDIDWWLGQSFFCKYVPSIYVDEGYQAGAGQSKMGAGVAGLWTRGRAFGFRMLLGTQRPAFISKFVITESDLIYEGMLLVETDRKTIYEATGHKETLQIQKPHHFLFVKQDGSKPKQLRPIDLTRESLYDGDTRLETRKRMRRN